MSSYIDIAILVGLTINVLLAWKADRDFSRLEEVVAQMLMELGEKGILKVDITGNEEEDDD